MSTWVGLIGSFKEDPLDILLIAKSQIFVGGSLMDLPCGGEGLVSTTPEQSLQQKANTHVDELGFDIKVS
jgi:hypothetical protein